MRVLQINGVIHQGSTGNIVDAITDYVRSQGDECTIAYGIGSKTSDGNKFCYRFEQAIYRRCSMITGFRYGFAPLATKRLLSFIEKYKPDVVHLHSINGNCVNIFALLTYLKSRTIPTVVTNHAEFFYTGNCTSTYGCTKYINNIKFNQETGEIPDGLELSLKLDKIKEEEKFDGYYSIVTSEKHLSDKEIRDIYKGLWKIEETFKITKSELETRPVFVWTDESIEAHFLSCFVSLLIIRLLEQKLNRKYSNEYVINSLVKYTSTNLEHNIYLQSFRNDVIKDLESIFNVDLSRKYLTLSEIKKILNL